MSKEANLLAEAMNDNEKVIVYGNGETYEAIIDTLSVTKQGVEEVGLTCTNESELIANFSEWPPEDNFEPLTFTFTDPVVSRMAGTLIIRQSDKPEGHSTKPDFSMTGKLELDADDFENDIDRLIEKTEELASKLDALN